MQLFDGIAQDITEIENLVVERADVPAEKVSSRMGVEPDAQHGMPAGGTNGERARDLSPKLDRGIRFVIGPPGAFAKIKDHFHISAGKDSVHKGGIRCGMKEIIMPDVWL